MLKSESDTRYDPEYFLWAIAWLLVDSFCARSDFERSRIVTIRELSTWNYQCCFEPIQWEIAWSFHLEYSADGKHFAQPLIAKSVQPSLLQWRIAWSFYEALLQYDILFCTLGEVSFPISEQIQWEIARVTSKELLLPNMDFGEGGHATNMSKPPGCNCICEIIMDHHSRLGFLNLGVLVTWPHSLNGSDY